MQESVHPVSITERIQTIDIIRGLALCGIVIINFTVDRGLTEPWKGFTGPADQFVFWTISFFMNDKFMAIYCFLFGLGFAIQMQRAELRRSSFVPVYLRRVLTLFFIGAIHQILSNGSVLPQYAITAVILLLLHRLPLKWYPIAAIVCFLIPSIVDFAMKEETGPIVNAQEVAVNPSVLDANIIGVYERVGQPGRYNVITRIGSNVFSQGRSGTVRLIAQSETEFRVEDARDKFIFLKDSTGTVNKLEIQPDGLKPVFGLKIQKGVAEAQKEMAPTYSKSVTMNANLFWDRLRSWDWWRFFFWKNVLIEILPLFLLGAYAGQRNIFTSVAANRKLVKNVMSSGLIIGGLSIIFSLGFRAWNFAYNIEEISYSHYTQQLVRFFNNLGIIGVSTGYVAWFTLILDNAKWKSRLSILAPVGRMGLTNYLLQSMCLTFIIDFGFHIDGVVGPFWRLVIALVILIILLIVSNWWFKRFRVGPAEWIWRSLTYWKTQPYRLD